MDHLPRQLGSDDPELSAVLALLKSEFAYMEDRINPPSSMQRMTIESLRHIAGTSTVWVIGRPVMACMILSLKGMTLYLGKLAVAKAVRGRGLARKMSDHATGIAQEMGLTAVTLETRVELVENHAIFAALGFVETGRSAHPGHEHPTSIQMAKRLEFDETLPNS